MASEEEKQKLADYICTSSTLPCKKIFIPDTEISEYVEKLIQAANELGLEGRKVIRMERRRTVGKGCEFMLVHVKGDSDRFFNDIYDVATLKKHGIILMK